MDASSLDGDALNGAGGGQPPAPPSGVAAFQSSLQDLRSRGKAKSNPSRIPKPAVATVTPRVTRAHSRHSQ